jgi:CxxC-x17-CxxC domain-containing protein
MIRKTCPLIEKEKCSLQNVGTVETIVKYHFSQKMTDLFIAESASKITNQNQDLVVVDLEDQVAMVVTSGGYGGNRGSRFGRRDDRPREMFDAKCGDCGNDCQVPFKPKDDRPVYCRDCFQNHKQN